LENNFYCIIPVYIGPNEVIPNPPWLEKYEIKFVPFSFDIAGITLTISEELENAVSSLNEKLREWEMSIS
jgi:hypothetical protein